MRIGRVAQVVLAVLLFASPAHAYRREYSVTLDGARKPGSEVCFYGGDSAADAFALFFSYTRVGCLPADQVLDLPAGLFHAFARHPDGFVSKDRDFFIQKTASRTETGYEMLEIPLVRAAYADVTALRASLKPGQKAGVWLAPGVDSAGAYVPLVDGEDRILVPAAMPFVPMVVAHGAPIVIGRETVLSAGESRRIDVTPSRGTADVLLWIKLDTGALQAVSDKVGMPKITLASGETELLPLFPDYRSIPGNHTLVIFKDVPPGPARIQVSGPSWLHYERELTAGASGVTLERSPVLLTPGSTLELSWNLGLGSPSEPECASDIPRPQIRVTLSQCAIAGAESRCQPTEQATVPFTPAGSMRFDGIPSGTYQVKVEGPFPKPQVLSVELPLGITTSVALPIKTFGFFGTVTLNGKPVLARLIFDTGEAVSDAAGAYTAALASDPLTNLIRIFVCGGDLLSYTPRETIRENTAFDIDLRVQPLTVHVVDATGKALPDASVTFTPVKEQSSDTGSYTSPPLVTNQMGDVQFTSVPADKALVLCATHIAYTRTCTSPLPPKELATGKIVLRLQRSMLRGRVTGHVGTGSLTLVDQFGRITEEVSLQADGSFAMQKSHGGMEHAVYVSDRHALTVLPLPYERSDRAEILLTLPPAPVRSFAVRVPAMKSADGFVGVWIGQKYVPLETLAFHQELRGRDARISRGQALVIVEIAESAPITVAYAPDLPSKGDFVDPFTLPQYAGVERHQLMGDSVTLDARE